MPLRSSGSVGAQRYIRSMKTLAGWQPMPTDPDNRDAEPISNFEPLPDESPANARFESAPLDLFLEES